MPDRRDFMKTAALAGLSLSFPNSARPPQGLKVKPLPSADDPAFWKKLRDQFPMPPDEGYCNTGTLGAPPVPVLRAMVDHITKYAQEIAHCDWSDGGINLLSGYFPYVDLRKKIGRLINAEYKSIALTQNATMGMNFLANGLDLPEGAEIITTDKEHSGGRSGWQLLAKRRGTIYREVPIPVPAENPGQIISAFENAIGPKTRVMSFPHITSGTGTILPVRDLCMLAKSKGLFSIVDGAQAVGHVPVDVQDIGCDFYYSSPHKWMLAPAGTGILYLSKQRVDSVWTTIASGNWDNHEDNGFRLTQRGTGSAALMVGLEAAVDFHFAVGPERIHHRIKQLGDRLRKGLDGIPKTRILTPLHPEMSSGLTLFNVAAMNGKDLQDELWKRGKLQPRAQGGKRGVRFSTHIYNSSEELDRALAIVEDLSRRG